MSQATSIWRSRARVAEAMLLLLLARMLIALAPMRWWRGSLGRVASEAGHSVANPAVANPAAANPAALRVAKAVNRAARRLPLPLVCLPRAMAVQWMCRRRKVGSSLVFLIAPRTALGLPHDLHAWVEAGGEVVIGKDEARPFHRGLVLVQP